MDVRFNRLGAAAGVVALGIAGLVAAPAAAAAEPAAPDEPWCEVTRVVNSSPEPSEGAIDWWGVNFRTSEGLEDWSFHFRNKQPEEVSIYSYYLRPDPAASRAAGYAVVPNRDGTKHYLTVPSTGELSFALLVPDGDEAPVVDCVVG